VLGWARTAGFVISLESLGRLFRATTASNFARHIAGAVQFDLDPNMFSSSHAMAHENM